MKQLNKKTFLLALPLALLLLWFLASWYATKKAEEKLNEFVFDAGLQGIVHWDKVKATPFGTVTLSTVSLKLGQQALVADKVIIRDFQNDDKKQSLDVQIESLADQTGHAPKELVGSLAHMTGRTQIAPLDVAITLDTDYKKNATTFGFDLTLPDLVKLNGQLDLKDIQGLAALQQATQQNGLAGLAQLQSLAQIQLVSLSLNLQDQGAMTRYVDLHKRYQEVPTPGENVSKAQDETYKTALSQLKTECLQTPVSFIKDPKKACHALHDFLSLKDKKLAVKIGTQQPVAIAELVESALWGGLPRLENKLYIEAL